jgi:ribosomal protein L11 methylase PrmA
MNEANPPTTETWWEIHIACSDPDEAAALASFAGAALTETLSENTIRAFVSGDANEFIAALPDSLTVTDRKTVERRNWHESCPELWEPKRISNLTVIPVKGLADAPKRHPDEVLIIPGTGFGTGHHPATAMLIARLQSLASFYGTTPPNPVLDLGCGSAILAIVAKILWPNAAVEGIDNDPLALENAQDNLTINQLSTIPLICGTLESAQCERYELIIANLYCSLLLELEPQLAQRCKRLILSGVMEGEAESLLAGFKGWSVVSTKIEAGWFSAELVR